MKAAMPNKVSVEFLLYRSDKLEKEILATGETWDAEENETIEDGEEFHRIYRLRNEHSGQELNVSLRMLHSDIFLKRERVLVHLGLQF